MTKDDREALPEMLDQLCADAARAWDRYHGGAIDRPVVTVRLTPRAPEVAREAISRARERWPGVSFDVQWSQE